MIRNRLEASLKIEVERLSDGTFILDAPWAKGAIYTKTFEEGYIILMQTWRNSG